MPCLEEPKPPNSSSPWASFYIPEYLMLVLDGDRFKSQPGGHIARKKPKPPCMSLGSEVKVSSGSWFITPWGPCPGPSELPSGSICLWPHKAGWDTKSIYLLFQYGSSFLLLQLVLKKNCLVLPVSTTALAHYSCLLYSDSHNAPFTAYVLLAATSIPGVDISALLKICSA